MAYVRSYSLFLTVSRESPHVTSSPVSLFHTRTWSAGF